MSTIKIPCTCSIGNKVCYGWPGCPNVVRDASIYPPCNCGKGPGHCNFDGPLCKLTSSKKHDSVNHPTHYGGQLYIYEAIRVIEAWKLDFCLGNTIKYISRAGKKDPAKELEDLEKAAWYLNRRIEQLKGKQ